MYIFFWGNNKNLNKRRTSAWKTPGEEPCFPSDLEVWPLKLYAFHDVELPGPYNAQAPCRTPRWEWGMENGELNIGTRKKAWYIGYTDSYDTYMCCIYVSKKCPSSIDIHWSFFFGVSVPPRKESLEDPLVALLARLSLIVTCLKSCQGWKSNCLRPGFSHRSMGMSWQVRR